jgi:hypothetical protein
MERSDTMRTITYGGAVSLDGFLAGIDGSLDWLHFSKDVQQIMTDYGKDVDTILTGRKTYEVALAQHPPARKNPKSTKRRPQSEPAMRTYVFSRTLKSIDVPGTELINRRRCPIRPRSQKTPGKGNLPDGRRGTRPVPYRRGPSGPARFEHPPTPPGPRHFRRFAIPRTA